MRRDLLRHLAPCLPALARRLGCGLLSLVLVVAPLATPVGAACLPAGCACGCCDRAESDENGRGPDMPVLSACGCCTSEGAASDKEILLEPTPTGSLNHLRPTAFNTGVRGKRAAGDLDEILPLPRERSEPVVPSTRLQILLQVFRN